MSKQKSNYSKQSIPQDGRRKTITNIIVMIRAIRLTFSN